MSRTKGFSLVESLMIVGVVILMAGVGYVGWKALTKSDTSTRNTASSKQQSAEVITTKADLEAAEKALDDLNFDDDAAAQAQSQANL